MVRAFELTPLPTHQQTESKLTLCEIIYIFIVDVAGPVHKRTAVYRLRVSQRSRQVRGHKHPSTHHLLGFTIWLRLHNWQQPELLFAPLCQRCRTPAAANCCRGPEGRREADWQTKRRLLTRTHRQVGSVAFYQDTIIDWVRSRGVHSGSTACTPTVQPRTEQRKEMQGTPQGDRHRRTNAE